VGELRVEASVGTQCASQANITAMRSPPTAPQPHTDAIDARHEEKQWKATHHPSQACCDGHGGELVPVDAGVRRVCVGPL
jgi:hypothetical protein